MPLETVPPPPFFLPQVSPCLNLRHIQSQSGPPVLFSVRDHLLHKVEEFRYISLDGVGWGVEGWTACHASSLFCKNTLKQNESCETANVSSQNEFPPWVGPTKLVWDLFMPPTHLWERGRGGGGGGGLEWRIYQIYRQLQCWMLGSTGIRSLESPPHVFGTSTNE